MRMDVPPQDDEAPDAPGVRRRILALLSVAALAFGSLGIVACGEEESAGTESGGAGAADVGKEKPEQGAADQPREVTLSELLENPAVYVGEEVAVSGQVTSTVNRDGASPAAITLGESVDEDVLVLATQQAKATTSDIAGNRVLRVEGTVLKVDDALADEDEFLFEESGDDEFLADYADEVAIAATEIGGESGEGPGE